MSNKPLAFVSTLLALTWSEPAPADVEIPWWHSMTGGLNDWVLGLTNGFSAK